MAENEERVLWKGNSSHIVNLGTYFLCGFVMLAAVFLYFWLGLPDSSFVRTVFNIVFLLAFAIPLLVIVSKVVVLKSVVYEITTQRIKVKSGIFTVKLEEAELYRIKDSTFTQPFFYRLFSKGDIILNTSDRTTSVIHIKAIPNAENLREEIRRNVELRRQARGVRELDVDQESSLSEEN